MSFAPSPICSKQWSYVNELDFCCQRLLTFFIGVIDHVLKAHPQFHTRLMVFKKSNHTQNCRRQVETLFHLIKEKTCITYLPDQNALVPWRPTTMAKESLVCCICYRKDVRWISTSLDIVVQSTELMGAIKN